MPSELQRYGSMGSISYHGQNVKMEGVPFTEIETQTKYQLDVDSDAAEATRTAALGDVDKQTDLMRQVSELGGKVRLSDQSITDIVRAVLSDTGSKLDAKTFTERMRALSDYIALNKDVSWDDVYTFASDIAEQLMQKSSHKNDEMWKHYPELHQMTNKKIPAATIARTVVLALALVNQLLSAAGKPVLPIDSASVEQWVTAGLTTAAAIWAWWENNSFTPEAIHADELLDQMQGKIK